MTSFTQLRLFRYSNVTGLMPESISTTRHAISNFPRLDTDMVAMLQSSCAKTLAMNATLPFTSPAVMIVV